MAGFNTGITDAKPGNISTTEATSPDFIEGDSNEKSLPISSLIEPVIVPVIAAVKPSDFPAGYDYESGTFRA